MASNSHSSTHFPKYSTELLRLLLKRGRVGHRRIHGCIHSIRLLAVSPPDVQDDFALLNFFEGLDGFLVRASVEGFSVDGQNFVTFL